MTVARVVIVAPQRASPRASDQMEHGIDQLGSAGVRTGRDRTGSGPGATLGDSWSPAPSRHTNARGGTPLRSPRRPVTRSAPNDRAASCGPLR